MRSVELSTDNHVYHLKQTLFYNLTLILEQSVTFAPHTATPRNEQALISTFVQSFEGLSHAR